MRVTNSILTLSIAATLTLTGCGSDSSSAESPGDAVTGEVQATTDANSNDTDSEQTTTGADFNDGIDEQITTDADSNDGINEQVTTDADSNDTIDEQITTDTDPNDTIDEQVSTGTDLDTGADNTSSFELNATDPIWGQGFDVLFGETWRTSSSGTSIVRRCGAAATEIPEIPGWGFDSEAAAECLFHNPNSPYVTNVSSAVPVYSSPNNNRLEFGDEFARHLYAGDGLWQCSVETRASNNEPFVLTGSTEVFQFSKEGQNWRFAHTPVRRVLQIKNTPEWDPVYSFGEVWGQGNYAGYTIIDHNILTIYKDSQERLNCTAQQPSPQIDLPADLDAFESITSAGVDTLTNRTMSCRIVESLIRQQNTSQDQGFQSIADRVDKDFSLTVEPRDDRTVNFQLTDEFGLSETTFTVEDNVFQNSTVSPGTGIATTTIYRFKDLGSQLMAERFQNCTGQLGGCETSFEYSLCQ